jgi:DDE superfamily endonuclease/Helix-turn-helix of DDE superfamily endonuclease
MITYTELQTDRQQFLALTGLTLSEFQRLLTAFPQAYQQHYPASQTAEGQPRQRAHGGGCKGRLEQPEDKLLFLLVYLKTYPLQAVMGELFDLSTPRVNYWIHRLLPVLRSALDDLGVLPERDPTHFARVQGASEKPPRLIIDATERRRQRPKNPEKQALFYSGRKKKHCDKNVVVVNTRGGRIDYLGRTCPGKTHDKKLADEEGISYPPGATLYKDTGFQGYAPAVEKTCQAKKKATPRRTHGG